MKGYFVVTRGIKSKQYFVSAYPTEPQANKVLNDFRKKGVVGITTTKLKKKYNF